MEENSRCFSLVDDLPRYLWEFMIFPKLGLRDLTRCSAVCHSWKPLVAENPGYHHRLPWLMISQNKDTQSGTFLSLSENKIYNLKLTPLATEAFCCGSSQGCLIMANRDSNFLFNPFFKTQITLPKQYVPRVDANNAMCEDDLCCYFRKATILLSSPTLDTSQCVIAASGSNSHIVEMCRPQDSEWSIFGTVKEEINEEEDNDEEYLFSNDEEKEEENQVLPEESDEEYLISDDEEDNQILPLREQQLEVDGWLFHDILFYKGILYGLTRKNILVSFEFGDSSKPLGYSALNMLPMNTHPMEEGKMYANYLVESCGELLMVSRTRNIINDGIKVIYSTIKFLVFKLDRSSDLLKWVQVQSLGDQMLFLGKNSSLSISATGIPGFKGNCIYFSDDRWPHFWLGLKSRPSCLDNGVFYLDDGRFESFFTPDDSHPMVSQPVWVTPKTIFHE